MNLVNNRFNLPCATNNSIEGSTSRDKYTAATPTKAGEIILTQHTQA